MLTSFFEILANFVIEVLFALPRIIGAFVIWVFSGQKWSMDYFYEEHIFPSFGIGACLLTGSLFLMYQLVGIV